jgi:hypothetical protein
MDRSGSRFSFLSSVRNRFQLILFLLTLAIGLITGRSRQSMKASGHRGLDAAAGSSSA